MIPTQDREALSAAEALFTECRKADLHIQVVVELIPLGESVPDELLDKLERTHPEVLLALIDGMSGVDISVRLAD
jgi:hypothetical protein